MPPVQTEPRLMVLDTASLYFRAFFGVPEILADDGTPGQRRPRPARLHQPPGRPVPPHPPGLRLGQRLAPAVARRPGARRYKGHRVEYVVKGDHPYVEEVPDPLEVQVPIIQAVLEAFGICVIGEDGYEADDVIGSLATQADMPVDVVTGDRDLFQLVDDRSGVRVLYVARGVGNHERVTDHVVVEKYAVLPSQYADFATMRGDASDGLPGVPGVGEKTASTLLLKFGDMRGIVDAATTPTPTWRPARARRSRPPRTTSRWRRRSSRSPATSSSAGSTPRCPPSRPTRSTSSSWPSTTTSAAPSRG